MNAETVVSLVQVRIVVLGDGLTPEKLQHEVELMLQTQSKKLWVGNLVTVWDDGSMVQGRQISRRALVGSYNELLVQILSLVSEDYKGAEVFGNEGGSTLVTGLLIRPFVAEDQPDNQTQPIVIDCVNREEFLFLAYHPTPETHNRGLCGSRAYTVRSGELRYAD